MTKVSGLFAGIGSIAGGYLGWWLATPLGLMGQMMVSIVGTAAGVYYGRQLANRLLG